RRRAARTLRIGRVQDVVLERRAFFGSVLLRLAQPLDVDRGRVAGGADRAAEERAVVVAVVPGKPALVVSVLPEGGHELDRLQRLLAVERDRLAVGLELLAAERPEIRIGEGGRVIIGMTERLPDRPVFCLEQLAGCPITLPGVGKLGDADLVEPGFAVADENTERGP